ncbi:DUF4123 domain-containing protein [Pseudomonas matsuisoli]|uniref:DUF4123 domain-containing protein n=1 Tax=Pseudomonas matsuisoli TaxID=1515666 RepID=A0A917PLD6_9PSED|nr:DUF4123 domain-containing protein [Pseudomonas matsuisoli]GGJ82918.1 hypothetical protein GCM10009304_06180 [Pseudomonas matsuisoli]
MSGHFLLVDGVQRQDALRWLYSFGEPIEVLPIYVGSRWDALRELGPILVQVEVYSQLLGELQSSREFQKQASQIYSTVSLGDLADHLRHFITVTDDAGSNSLFRFADPLVASHWLDSYPRSAYRDLLGPIGEWHVSVPPPSWAPSASVTRRAYRPETQSPAVLEKLNHLTRAQLDALENAYQQRFKERLYDWLIRDYPEVLTSLSEQERGIWMERRLREAYAWGLVSERCIAIWLERCACWGEDFATRHDSPYRYWLEETPKARSLSPEMRIQALDDDA